MWALAEYVARVEREQWRLKFGTDFTGFHEGRRVRFTWREVTVGHVCRAAYPFGDHAECIRMVAMRWVWLRSAAAER